MSDMEISRKSRLIVIIGNWMEKVSQNVIH